MRAKCWRRQYPYDAIMTTLSPPARHRSSATRFRTLAIVLLMTLLVSSIASFGGGQRADAAATGSISGTLTGPSLVNGVVYLQNTDGGIVSGVSSTGAYSFPSVADGTYVVYAFGTDAEGNNFRGYHSNATSLAAATRITVAGNSLTGIDVALSPGNRITGTISAPAAVSLQNVHVQLQNDAGNFVNFANPDATGQFRFDNVDAGTYVIFASAYPSEGAVYGGYFANAVTLPTATRITVTPQDVASGSILSGKNFSISLGATVSGVISSQAAAPSNGSAISAYRWNGGSWDVVQRSTGWGAYAMGTSSWLPPGQYAVGFSDPDPIFGLPSTYSFCDQYWDAKTSLAQATQFSLAAGETKSGVNATLASTCPTGVVSRLAGPDRFATSAAISAASFNPGVPVAYVAFGRNFPDALSAAPVAGIQDGPILLTETGSIPDVIKTELTRLNPGKIVILGSAASISESVKSALDAYTAGTVERIAGPDRFETSAAISAASFAPNVPVAYVAFGRNFPDALSAAPVAGIQGAPILLTETSSIPTAIRTELARLKPGKIVILGSAASISEGVKTALDEYTTGPVERVAGPDRFATSAAVSAAAFNPGVPVVYIAFGRNFPDALSAAPVAGIQGGPILLTETDSIPDSIKAELTRLKPAKIVILGSAASVSEGVKTALAAYLAE